MKVTRTSKTGRRTTVIADFAMAIADFDPDTQSLSFEHHVDDGTIILRLNVDEILKLHRAVQGLFGEARQVRI